MHSLSLSLSLSLSHSFTGFMVYAFIVVSLSIYLIYVVAPQYGQSNILVYIAICSLIGSLTVMACKGLSIAVRLTLTGDSQLKNPLGWFFLIAVASCIAVQMNYLNRSLDTFNTSLVTPIYYVMFTTMTIIASGILFKEWNILTAKDIVGALCGFITIICGVFLLHAFKDINVKISDLIEKTNKPNGASGAVAEDVTSNHHDSIVVNDTSSFPIEMESLSPSSPRSMRTHRGKVLSPVITNGNVDHSDLSEPEDEKAPFVQ